MVLSGDLVQLLGCVVSLTYRLVAASEVPGKYFIETNWSRPTN